MAKKNWIFIKRGLSEDPKHRSKMGECIWLFMHIIDRADWETGIAYDWKDEQEAADMGMPITTLRLQRRKLDECGYVTVNQKQHSLDIVIHEWIDPRNYSGAIKNRKFQSDSALSPTENQGDIQGDIQGNNPLTPSKFQGEGQGDSQGEGQGIMQVNTHTSDSLSLSSSKETTLPEEKTKVRGEIKVRGIEAAIAMGRPTTENDLLPETRPAHSVLEGLSVLNPHWPQHGENREWDRVARLVAQAIQEGNGTVEKFVAWVKVQKDFSQRIQWYGRKPANIWEDWPLACPGSSRPLLSTETEYGRRLRTHDYVKPSQLKTKVDA